MKRIAFLSFDWDYRIVPEYYLGLQECVKSFPDVQIVVFNAFGRYYASHVPRQDSLEVFTLCNVEDYDGFIVQGNRTWPPDLRQQFVDNAVQRNKPVVSINYELVGAHAVGTNNYQEEYELVCRVLQDRGCRRPVFVNGLKTSVEAQDRAQAFKDACAKFGMPDAKVYQANWQMSAGVVTAKKMLRRPKDLPDAIFCCNDDLAVGVQETLQDGGVRVPDDAVITGFDNRQICQFTTPHITTVDRDYQTIGATALKTLMQLLAGGEVPNKTYSPARLVLRESCGYVLQHETRESKALPTLVERLYDALGEFQSIVLTDDSLYGILENSEIYARKLDCSNVFLSLNDEYLKSVGASTSCGYGPTSLLVACKERVRSLPCDDNHMYTVYETKSILPPQVPFDAPIYTVSSLHRNEVCMGSFVTEGVPTAMTCGLNTIFLTVLASAIDSALKTGLLHSSNGD
ncbi:MAG: substrate-binding domain-containing protein [Atopobiaceae bacterium]|nr:substrate-binding domain-containing protein [Atopobiaceae bacterium]